ncbi:MAG: hypothetical protein M5R36_14310 [Deltaproteobacteria bacterium]|nr:hypothetical protein [Deltaproteobacteria bacterium]
MFLDDTTQIPVGRSDDRTDFAEDFGELGIGRLQFLPRPVFWKFDVPGLSHGPEFTEVPLRRYSAARRLILGSQSANATHVDDWLGFCPPLPGTNDDFDVALEPMRSDGRRFDQSS